MDSKEYSWKCVTANELLCPTACDLVFAYFVPSAATTPSYIYDGENTLGTLIIPYDTDVIKPEEFLPAEPIYCRRGLYVVVGDAMHCVFVQWRPRPGKEG